MSKLSLPEVGDNITSGRVVAVLINAGDSVNAGDTVVEIETDKAVVEVPASESGTVSAVLVNVGDTVPVGGVLAELGGAAAAPAAPAEEQPAPAPEAPKEEPKAEAAPAAPAPVAAAAPAPATSFAGQPVYPAAPSVRRLARELGVTMEQIAGSGERGRINEGDIRRAAAGESAPAPMAGMHAMGAAPAVKAEPLPDFSKWGTIRREEMNGIRKATVRSMSNAWATVPMVTHFDKADVTAMEEARKRFGERVAKAGGKLTTTHILMKVVAGALRRFPKFGASIDLENEEVIYKDFVNIGVAVDTPVGLLVPVVKNADHKSITELVLDLTDLAERARERKLKPDEMQGGTFTISNLGGIGGHAFTPIVNPPQVAILGVSRGGFEPVWNKATGEFEPRNMLPLSLSYDHRLIDGADAARFLRYICEAMEDPFLISL